MYCSLIWKSDLNCTATSETDLESTRLIEKTVDLNDRDILVRNLFKVSY